MNQINKLDTTFISERAQEILNKPIHTESNERKAIVSWKVAIESDKILTLKYSNLLLSACDSLFLETLARLCPGKRWIDIATMPFREIENYLRDQNHLPSFDPSKNLEVIASFEQVKKDLMSAIVLKKLDEFEETNSWHELTLVEKNRKIRLLVDELNILFSPVKKLELALAEEAQIALIMNGFPLDPEVIESIVIALFKAHDLKTGLKVVAVQ